MESGQFRDLIDHQDGAVARWQLRDAGASANDIRRMLRRRELVTVHPGVYVVHTGPLTWANRAWAGVLHYWPAALTDDSAVHLAGDVIHVAVDKTRSLAQRPGTRLHRLTDFEHRVQWNARPPRVRLEDSVLRLCAKAPTRVQALSIASDICRRRRTTPERLLTQLGRHPRLHHRAWLRDVLQEVADGVQSPLESSYVSRVERPHGLPRGVRQLREATSQGVVYRDVVYEEQGVYVELDGRVGHQFSGERWADMDRDLEAASGDRLTLRVGWRHTEDEPCRTAGRVGAVLRLRGWRGIPGRCGPSCSISVPFGVTG